MLGGTLGSSFCFVVLSTIEWFGEERYWAEGNARHAHAAMYARRMVVAGVANLGM